MNERDLMLELYSISGCSDALVIFKREHNPNKWGDYFIQNRVIVLYVLNERGEQYSDETLIREGIHELTHHILYHHTKDYAPKDGDEHDIVFKEKFAELISLYYNGLVPMRVQRVIREEGLEYESSKKKRLLKRDVRLSSKAISC